jgi:hypothetical protein
MLEGFSQFCLADHKSIISRIIYYEGALQKVFFLMPKAKNLLTRDVLELTA